MPDYDDVYDQLEFEKAKPKTPKRGKGFNVPERPRRNLMYGGRLSEKTKKDHMELLEGKALLHTIYARQAIQEDKPKALNYHIRASGRSFGKLGKLAKSKSRIIPWKEMAKEGTRL